MGKALRNPVGNPVSSADRCDQAWPNADEPCFSSDDAGFRSGPRNDSAAQEAVGFIFE